MYHVAMINPKSSLVTSTPNSILSIEPTSPASVSYPDLQHNNRHLLKHIEDRAIPGNPSRFKISDSHQDMSRAGKLAPEQLPVLFIKNLNYEVTDGDLFKLFDPDETGIIRQIRKGISVDTKGTAYVVFWNAMDAKNALEKLNGFNFQNRYLVVLWHQPEKTLKMKESKEDVQARQESLVPSSSLSTASSSTINTTLASKKKPIPAMSTKKSRPEDVARHARKVALTFVRGFLPQKPNKICVS
ncbi:hypothetical protein GGS21DRAFT_543098 [Xylaria nigripes]|nr:hypothetical protein GGS21DRAFT_543098 [Xylaria nigripes]